MIPFAPSFYPVLIFLMLVFGWPFVVFWGFWFVRLKKSPTARQHYQQKHRIKDESFVQTPISSFKIVKEMARQQPLSTIVFVVWVLSAVLMIEFNLTMTKIEAESQAEEAKRTPTLAHETTLAGITMPAGTKLELLHKGAVGEQWVKPEYFQNATFPKPILWQGVMVGELYRVLDDRRGNDNSDCVKHPQYGWGKCSNLATYETTQILWGKVITTATQPINNGQFECYGKIVWELVKDEQGNLPSIDASLSAPVYQMSQQCTLAKDKVVSSENGFLTLTLPKDSHLSISQMADDDQAKFWVVQSGDGSLHGDLFSVQIMGDEPTLHLRNINLRELKGYIVKNTTQCPLPQNSYVKWDFKKPNILQVFSDIKIEKCGQFDLEYLDKHPVNLFTP